MATLSRDLLYPVLSKATSSSNTLHASFYAEGKTMCIKFRSKRGCLYVCMLCCASVQSERVHLIYIYFLKSCTIIKRLWPRMSLTQVKAFQSQTGVDICTHCLKTSTELMRQCTVAMSLCTKIPRGRIFITCIGKHCLLIECYLFM